ncbi:MAG: ribose 5-phosphate isomerase B [Candidatus Omnitrophica bacterium]|nr:ribose 5-phosphate isomerase B [Candidatus Omnitrophota bacterium]
MKIYIGADHRGVVYKAKICDMLEKLGHQVNDLGSFDEKVSCDYPDIGKQVAEQVAANKGSRGMLICMSGIGQSIVANKVKGAYAALCYNREAAALSRQHNNANVLVLSSKFVPQEEIKPIIETWLSTDFEGGRHLRRVEKIKEIENHR